MNTYTTSQARADLFKLIDNINETHDPIYIVGKRNKAVLIAEEDYRSMLETLYITSIPGMKESIIEENKKPLSDFAEEIDL